MENSIYIALREIRKAKTYDPFSGTVHMYKLNKNGYIIIGRLMHIMPDVCTQKWYKNNDTVLRTIFSIRKGLLKYEFKV